MDIRDQPTADPTGAPSSARARLVEAAFALFAEHGYELTTVDDIADRAGVGRSTFFRQYRSKEDVIFPEHETLLEAVAAHFRRAGGADAVAEVCAGARLVLSHYLDEGARARQRYALIRQVPALRDREIASVARYQRLFRNHISAATPAGPRAALYAEFAAAAVVSAHNHVLRRWLQGQTSTPLPEYDAATTYIRSLFGTADHTPAHTGTTMILLEDSRDAGTVATLIRHALEPGPAPIA